ncbi:glucosamine-6-phosphate deaminase [Akkermansiaceae bacterium]|nr:glucosamine-6-phosphate deaminase [Akkermansiaceae bacterium]
MKIGESEAWVGDCGEMCRKVADEVETLLRSGEDVVLGLATGSTPLPLYAELIRRHREEGLSFAKVTSFNLDEYEGIGRDNPRSYWAEMWENLFSQVDIDPEKVHVPPSHYEDAQKAAAEYEARIRDAGGVDWQLLGIGRDGHVGFNEPGSDDGTRTRRVVLADETREDAAPTFGGLPEVPTHAMTMGVGTILEARRIVLMARGGGKKEIVAEALTGDVGAHLPASYLRSHQNVGWFLDHGAAGIEA